MGRINSRRKGKTGEKKARSVLTDWTGLEFAGVPASGGLRWKKAENISGDVVCTDALHRFDFSVEVKNHREINFEHLLMPHLQSSIKEFWQQCTSDAGRGKKLPLLMMRYDGIRPGDYFFTALAHSHFNKLKKYFDLSKPYMRCIGHGFVIMHPDVIFKSDYNKVKKLTSQIVQQEYGRGN